MVFKKSVTPILESKTLSGLWNTESEHWPRFETRKVNIRKIIIVHFPGFETQKVVTFRDVQHVDYFHKTASATSLK